MTPSAAGSSVDVILRAFFGPHNDARLTDAETFADLFRQTELAILPHRRGATTRWYGFARTERLARELRGLLLAAAGPTWSTWTGPAADLDAHDPVEGALLSVARGPVFRLEAPPGKDAGLECALLRMAKLLSHRPPTVAQDPRPQHRILSELLLSFVAGNDDRARSLVAELAGTGTLSAVNLLFLEVRRLDAMHDAQTLLEHPALTDLLRRRRPRHVTMAIARAVYRVHLAPFQAQWAEGDKSAAARARLAFGDLPADFQTVFGDRFLPDDRDMVGGRVLHHLMRGESSAADEVANRAADESREWLFALMRDPVDGVEQAAESQALDDPVVLLDRLLERPLDEQGIDKALRIAYTVDTQDAALRVVVALDRTSGAVLEAARRDRMFRVAENELRALAASSVKFEAELGSASPHQIDGWEPWFRRLAEDGPWEGCLTLTQRAATEWDARRLEEHDVHPLATAIELCANEARAQDAAVGGVAELLPWLDRHHWGVDISPVHRAALDLLLYAAEPGDVRDSVTIGLLERILAGRQDAATLSQRLSEFGEAWLELPSPKRLDWALAVLDVAADYGERSEPVMRFLGLVTAAIGRWPERVDASQRATIESIASDLGAVADVRAVFPAVRGDEDAGDPFDVFAGLTVGLYTLTPGVGQRVHAVMASRCPSARVEVNDDLVSTDALRAVATRADVMVVAYRSAQHAATDAIVAIRGRNGVVPVQGKGSAGCLRALEGWAVARLQDGDALAA